MDRGVVNNMQLINRGSRAKHEVITFRCTDQQAEQIRSIAKQHNTTVTDVLLQLVEMYSKSQNNGSNTGESTK